MKSQAQFAGEQYSRACDAVMQGGVKISMIVAHILMMVRGTEKFPQGNLWRDREVPPEGKVVHLERFEDYLLRPAREGLGFSSLLEVHKILEAHKRQDEAAAALAILRTEIPDYDRRVAGGEVARVMPTRKQGGTGANQFTKEGESKDDNVRSAKAKYGNSKTYLISRLKRDAADPACPGRTQARHWLKRLEAGDVSTRQASLAMGYVKPVASIPVDTAAHAIGGLLKVFTLAELATEIDRRQGEAQTSG